MRIPEKIFPVISEISRSYALPIEIWKANDGYRIMDAFFALAMKVKLSGLDVSSLPKGYKLLVTLFGWEAECQRESWNAFEWIEDFEAVAAAYSNIGLEAEAVALEYTRRAWLKSSGDYQVTSAAYEDASHRYSNESERLEYLVDYFCSNADELFYEQAANA